MFALLALFRRRPAVQADALAPSECMVRRAPVKGKRARPPDGRRRERPATCCAFARAGWMV